MENDPPQKGHAVSLPDAPDQEKMDQIRRRRLEKLSAPKPAPEASSPAGQSGATPVPAESSKSSSSASTSSQATPSTKPTTPAQARAENPFNKLGVQAAKDPASFALRSASTDSAAKRTRDASLSGETQPLPPKKQAPVQKEESVEEFADRIISHIFRITLDPHKTTDAQGHKLTFLMDLQQELQESGEPTRFSAANLDQALIEACTRVPRSKALLDYLLPCWKRTIKAQRALKGYVNERHAILQETRRLCMSNCVFAVTMPDLYGRDPNPRTDSLTPYLLKEPDDEHGLCLDFLQDAAARFDEDESVKDMLTRAVAGLSLQLSNMTMNDNYKPYMMALRSLTRVPAIVTAIAELPLFQMATSARGIEKHTILGPFFRISPLQPDVLKVYFQSPKTMDPGHARSAQNALRLTLATHQRELLDIINLFIRASPSSRNRTLDWFAYVVNENHKRRAMRVDEKLVSSDGFMMNVSVVLDGLCEPFMDATFSKISKIDIGYLRRNPRVNITDETKTNADQNASDKFYATKAEGTSNFISEVFFLTLAAHHYGSDAIAIKLRNLEKDIKYFEKQIVQLQSERLKFLNNPAQLRHLDQNLERFGKVLEISMAAKMGIEGVLFDDTMQGRQLQFMRYVIVWLLRVASGTEYLPGKILQLPLSEQQPEAWRCLPEYLIEDVTDHFKFIFRYLQHIIIPSQSDELIALCITFLRNSEYVKNPGVKSNLVTLLFQGTWAYNHRPRGILGDALIGEKFANDNLLHALMKYFIEAESTGLHSQFYDKFHIRYEIFQVIKCIWASDVYRQRLTQESQQNKSFFIRFVNLLLNDCTYVLDEALVKFPKIHDLQNALKAPADSMTPQERQAKEEELATAETQATSYMQLTNETMAMMKLFTAALSEAFTMPEIVQRLADMLDLNLDTLVGPKSTSLIVENREKYHFQPRQLLAEIVDVYLNLGSTQRFIEAVARDGRSYKPMNFDHASRILSRYALKSREELAAWDALKENVRKAKEADDQAEDDLGEIPDELSDPIMGVLLSDPVILPKSKITLDRSTIQAHLLNDPTDPFNRQPMKIEDCVVDTEMLEKVRLFKEQRMREKAEKAAAAAAADEGEKMDTSEG